jgi:hypothetical protein
MSNAGRSESERKRREGATAKWRVGRADRMVKLQGPVILHYYTVENRFLSCFFFLYSLFVV